jgi:hypothetical protein
MDVEPCNLTLKLAENNTTVTSGIIWLPVTIGNHQMRVQMYVLEDSSYPLILGCEFLDKHAATLRFHAGRRDLELPILSSAVKQLLNPVLSLIELLQIPPFSRCFAECSVSIAPDLPGTYFFEPNSELFV